MKQASVPYSVVMLHTLCASTDFFVSDPSVRSPDRNTVALASLGQAKKRQKRQNMIDRINSFFRAIQQTPIELYSEFGLQHKLAIFLRNNYEDLTVRLEYPTPRIFNPLPQFIKKEIDIYVTTQAGERYVIELKMPKDNCGAPNAMYHAIEDVKFLEQLRQANIDGCYSILATSCRAFWDAPRAEAGIYEYFNGQQITIQTIDVPQLPTFLHSKGQIQLTNIYQSNWHDYTDTTDTNWKYYVLDI